MHTPNTIQHDSARGHGMRRALIVRMRWCDIGVAKQASSREKQTTESIHFPRFRRSHHRVTRSQMHALLHKNTHTHRSFLHPPADRLIWRVMYQKVALSNFWWHVRPITHVVHACVCVCMFKCVWQHTMRYLSLVLTKWQTSWYEKGILWVEAVTDFCCFLEEYNLFGNLLPRIHSHNFL